MIKFLNEKILRSNIKPKTYKKIKNSKIYSTYKMV